MNQLKLPALRCSGPESRHMSTKDKALKAQAKRISVERLRAPSRRPNSATRYEIREFRGFSGQSTDPNPDYKDIVVDYLRCSPPIASRSQDSSAEGFGIIATVYSGRPYPSSRLF